MATEIRHPDGTVTPCPAAPLLAGAGGLAGRGFRARTGPERALPAGTPSDLWLVTASDGAVSPDNTATDGPAAVLAVGAMASPGLLKAGGPVRTVLEAWARVVCARRVLLASPRSLCAGVERAIEVVEALLERYAGSGRPVFVRRQIVHNLHVVRDMESRGAVFVGELEEVPDGAVVVFSAHGVSPAVWDEAARRGLEVVDATCPLVAKVHAEARRFAARGDMVVLVGHAGHAGHEEVQGTLGEASASMVLVESVEDVAALEVANRARVSYLTQTTLALDETSQVVTALENRFPGIRGPGSDDICYATTNRQHAVAAVAARSDVVLVVGSVNSSNSQRLVEIARRGGRSAYLIDDAGGIRPEWIERADTVGLTAGASAPQRLVDEVTAALGGLGPVTVAEHTTVTETVTFALPTAVRAR
ncbi:4-hydroxy-3-methylbut-2-enyl diphosphate reductase [Streptomyces sp. ET3-23]|uniref:4-hydroxy-3-methylbut-2-enyl diphosphate reductase n=1 Tax=Streptomyces sp. ET3-23 TaxID=2885643 RepID=UPI001D11A06D|nr:4-hydroxy-3-methylbut-2-enyl diphosphate reductase [Streptomyces sp. ET3-23]MCC2275213.1 4-hydroxy-3-methylbut-2-enyl diphosphate reductase [Streptomyces sp. ET3-23]